MKASSASSTSKESRRRAPASGALCLTLLTVPPGGQSAAHLHESHESAAYVISGSGEMFHGERLRQRMAFGPGDFVFIPAGAPHVVRNTSATDPLVGILARTDPNEQESVVLLPELEFRRPRTLTTSLASDAEGRPGVGRPEASAPHTR